MTYATLRCVHMGWRVIKVEPTPVKGRQSRGDPNRYIGRPVAGEDRHSYFVAPNVGKEAIAIDLKQVEGRKLLNRIISALEVDIFCTNTLPARHRALGFDYEKLKSAKPDLIWCAISAMGLSNPDIPGYDPVLQALCGYMDLTGHPDGPPLQCGPPIIDLRAGDEAFTQIILALMDRMETGKGRAIDISMARVAVAWLQTFLPMLDMGSPPSELRRSGNEHRQFIPVNSYRTRNGYIYIAVGSDAQWNRITSADMFAPLRDEKYSTNEGRRKNKIELHGKIEEITSAYDSGEVSRVLVDVSIPHSPITPIQDVAGLPFAAASLLKTAAPDGKEVRLPPSAVDTDYLENAGCELPFAPAYGANTDSVLAEAGLPEDEIRSLREKGVIA